MAAASDVRKNINLFLDGRGYAGQIDNFTAPRLAMTVEDFRGGGMQAPVGIKMGMEKLEASFAIIKYDPFVFMNWGLRSGNAVLFTARESLESFDGTVKGVIHTMRGSIREIDPGESKAGELNPISVTLDLVFYSLVIGGVPVQTIDVENMVHLVNGIDLLAAERAVLAL